MIEVAILLGALLHHPALIVMEVYTAPARVCVPISRLDKTWLPSGLQNVSIVEAESRFNPKAFRIEPNGTSSGLFQRYDRYHEQYRGQTSKHILAGTIFLGDCLSWEHGNFARASAHYNGGARFPEVSWKRGKKDQARAVSLGLYLWRHLR